MNYAITINGKCKVLIEADRFGYNRAVAEFKRTKKENKEDVVRLYGIFGEVLQEK